jgi:hypothetical protein
VAALAGEVNAAVSVGFEEVRGDLSHSLVHFPEERFVSGQTFVACRHDGILSTLTRESISRQRRRSEFRRDGKAYQAIHGG